MRRIRLVRWAPLICGWFLAGCAIPLPVPVVSPTGLGANFRENIEAGVPQNIKVGESTRVDVLLTLGAPDDRRDEDSWFRYRSVRDRGGIHVAFFDVVPILVPPESLSASRTGNWNAAKWILIRFDKSGVVSSVESGERQACLDQPVGTNVFAHPCFDEVVPNP